jgi:3-deoxy-D-manno-octulosonic-acid transferase
MKLFVLGRKNVLPFLQQNIKPEDKTIWFHAASLGEYEQGIPVIEKIKILFPKHKIVLTFFSPSGYEIRKNNTLADITVYLPLDTPKNAFDFINVVHPEMVFFIKYEFWINYLSALKKQNIKTYLISGIFRKKQLFFKPYGSFYRKTLQSFTYFYVQNETSKQLLAQLGYENCLVSGDTRFDRVDTILERDNHLDFIEVFKNDTLTVVAGSTWAKDEALFVDYINNNKENTKFIIAPHQINKESIAQLKNSLTKKTILFSEKDTISNLKDYQVLILDTIGILTAVYQYANIAYVGGGFEKSGIHNILEPATFGIPIVIGPRYQKFQEAIDLVNLKGCSSIKNQTEFDAVLDKFLSNDTFTSEKGIICADFVQTNKGASDKILKTLL